PELAKLAEISVTGIEITYRDMITGGAWATEGAKVLIRRQSWGAEATLTTSLAGTEGKRFPLTATARREVGAGETEIDLQFEGVSPAILSAQLPGIAWADLFEGEIAGFISTQLSREGLFGEVSGVIRAENGALRLGEGSWRAFDRVEAAFTYEPAIARLNLETLALTASNAEARLSGIVDLRRSADGALTALDTQLDIYHARIEIPEIFAEPLRFDDGQVTARIALDPLELNIRDTYLAQGDLVFNLDGRLKPSESGLVTDMRATAVNLTVDQLMAHWPLAAAENARDWIYENVREGLVTGLVSHFRVAEGEPQLSLDFSYTGLTSRYVGDMSPIANASGRGHLTFHDFFLYLERGTVVPSGGAAVELGPSRLVFRDLWGKVTPAEVSLNGSGGLGEILSLIDQQPLGLVGKIGLDPGEIAGTARVSADLSFPLLADLLLDQVSVDVAADLSDVAMPFDLAGRRVAVGGRQVRLQGTTEAMSIAGDLTIDGTPLTLTWSELYGRGADHRVVKATGRITPDLLASLGAPVSAFADGAIRADLTLEQAGDPSFSIALEADLSRASLVPEAIDWRKSVGAPGRLSLVARLGEVISIERLKLDTEDLDLSGAATLSVEGDLVEARFDRVRLDDRLDLAARIRPQGAGLDLTLSGRRASLDALSEDEEDIAAEDRPPLSVTFDLAEVQATETVALTDVIGTYRHDGREAEADLTAKIGGEAAIIASYSETEIGKSVLRVTSDDTGSLLRQFGVYDGAAEGELSLLADIAPRQGVELSGLLKVRGLRLGREDGLTRVLRRGRFADEEVIEVERGLTFRSIRVPFTYAGGKITLGDSFAKSPSLAVTAAGEVDPAGGKIDVIGTISPAYAVTGALDDVPILGRIFSGGEGEGIFAMTYAMRGSLEDPEISVNPLSLLTPGFLRDIFSGGEGTPNQDFIDRIEREN
ncbi:MAG: AsmA-like C-terminal region-containing protein, partial [Pseudomonadota bacterium]